MTLKEDYMQMSLQLLQSRIMSSPGREADNKFMPVIFYIYDKYRLLNFFSEVKYYLIYEEY